MKNLCIGTHANYARRQPQKLTTEQQKNKQKLDEKARSFGAT
jgi:hypothetical protein